MNNFSHFSPLLFFLFLHSAWEAINVPFNFPFGLPENKPGLPFSTVSLIIWCCQSELGGEKWKKQPFNATSISKWIITIWLIDGIIITTIMKKKIPPHSPHPLPHANHSVAIANYQQPKIPKLRSSDISQFLDVPPQSTTATEWARKKYSINVVFRALSSILGIVYFHCDKCREILFFSFSFSSTGRLNLLFFSNFSAFALPSTLTLTMFGKTNKRAPERRTQARKQKKSS